MTTTGVARELVAMARRACIEADLDTVDALIEANEGDDSELAKSLLRTCYARRAALRVQLLAEVLL